MEFVLERDPRRIYDRMVAWFVRHDVPVPLSTEEFLDGLRNRFPERDGMVFLPDQIPEYARKRALSAQPPQMEMFVADERSAIDWLTDHIRKRPSTYQEVHPEFTTQLGAGWKKHEARPELSALLEDSETVTCCRPSTSVSSIAVTVTVCGSVPFAEVKVRA